MQTDKEVAVPRYAGTDRHGSSGREAFRYLEQINDILCCPSCMGNLTIDQDTIECSQCLQQYRVSDNIPQFFWANEWEPSKSDVTSTVKEFYETTPFPNYDDFDNVGSLIEKARQGLFARLLDEQIPFGARVLECGCGTGQLSNFLSVANRSVIGTDMCLNSLRLGQKFKESHQLRRVHFLQMNLFRPVFKPGTFDVVICNGVLHHTSDPFGGYQSISRLVKPGGYILIGLYHQWGRMFTDARRVIFKLTKDRLRFLDPRLRRKDLGETRKNTWFADQYKHPRESKHTVREAQAWFKQSGFEFVKSIPKAKLFATVDEQEKLFKSEMPRDRPASFLGEFRMMFTECKEGGFFVAIGRKTA